MMIKLVLCVVLQHDCFGIRLVKSEMDTLMDYLSSAIPEGVSQDGKGVYLTGFVYLFQLFLDKNRPESCWQVGRNKRMTHH